MSVGQNKILGEGGELGCPDPHPSRGTSTSGSQNEIGNNSGSSEQVSIYLSGKLYERSLMVEPRDKKKENDPGIDYVVQIPFSVGSLWTLDLY